jgi:hypothetical protein
MNEIELKTSAKIQRKMMELDPGFMAKVMAWNSTSLEYDLLDDKKLQKRYMALLQKAKKLTEV